jgi:hypothetical protein
VRGGAGIFDVLPQPYINQLYTATTAPYLGTYGTVGPPVSKSPPQGDFPYKIPGDLGVVKPTQVVWAYNDTNIKRNYVFQYNFNIQRQITPTTTFIVAYVGSHGVHQPFLSEGGNSVQPVNVGNPIPGVGFYWPIPYTLSPACVPPQTPQTAVCGGAGQAALVNPNVQIIRSIFWMGVSSYNALELKLDKRVSHGFQVEGAFTWGKSIDTSSGSAAADTFTNEWNALPYYDFGLTRGLSAFNVGRNLVVNALWNAPTPKNSIASPLLGGWQLGIITSVSDGTPIMPSMGMDAPDLLGEINTTLNPPHLIPGCNPVNSRNVAHYLNAACFSMVPRTDTNAPYCDTIRSAALGFAPPGPVFCPNIRGDVARNSIIGPGLINIDFSVVKNNYIRKISESFNVQFRAEAFNVFNRPNFAPPSLNANQGGGAMEAILGTGQPNSVFGQLTATQTPNRQIQLALKLIW